MVMFFCFVFSTHQDPFLFYALAASKIFKKILAKKKNLLSRGLSTRFFHKIVFWWCIPNRIFPSMSFHVTGSPNSIQNTPQPLVSAMLKVKSEEMDGVIELPSRSSSPTISEVSVSRYFCLKANHFHPCIWNNFRWSTLRDSSSKLKILSITNLYGILSPASHKRGYFEEY